MRLDSDFVVSSYKEEGTEKRGCIFHISEDLLCDWVGSSDRKTVEDQSIKEIRGRLKVSEAYRIALQYCAERGNYLVKLRGVFLEGSSGLPVIGSYIPPVVPEGGEYGLVEITAHKGVNGELEIEVKQ